MHSDVYSSYLYCRLAEGRLFSEPGHVQEAGIDLCSCHDPKELGCVLRHVLGYHC